MSGLTSALASLTATYTDSEDEDIDEEEPVEQGKVLGSLPGSPDEGSGDSGTMKDQLSLLSGSGSGSNDMPTKSGSTGLVSYHVDDPIDDDAIDDYQSDSLSEKDEDLKGKDVKSTSSGGVGGVGGGGGGGGGGGEGDGEEDDDGDDEHKSPKDASIRKEPPPESAMEIEEDEGKIKLPPEPSGRPTIELQERVAKLYDRKLKSGLDMNVYIQKNKQFRNPSIYEKLIKHCNIDELGTNYSRDIYDPHEWTETSFYDELAKVQKADMDRREKEKKERTKVEFISGTAVKKPIGTSLAIPILPVGGSGSTTTSQTSADLENKRKSKWDQRGAPIIGISNLINFPSNQPTLLVQPNLATAVTGTKTTVISAFGNLPKKPKQ